MESISIRVTYPTGTTSSRKAYCEDRMRMIAMEIHNAYSNLRPVITKQEEVT